MRLYFSTVFTVFTLLSVFSLNVVAQNSYSYGPEISAEDYAQHVKALSSLKTNNARKKYIAQQFSRIGLASQKLTCQSTGKGLYATLKSTNNNSEITTQYIAQLDDIYQAASVLEIAERFMTQNPRPTHDIRFSFFTITDVDYIECPKIITAKLDIVPKSMESLDKVGLVRELNALYVEGK